MYQPLVSPIREGLIGGATCQISGKRFETQVPQEQDAKYAEACAWSIAMQHIQDRTLYTVLSITTPSSENGYSVASHRPQLYRTLVDRQRLYTADSTNLTAAVVAALEAE